MYIVLKYSNSKSVSYSMSLSLSLSIPCPCLCPCPCRCLWLCPYPCPCQIKNGAVNFLSNMAITLSVAQELKGPLTWECMDKIRWKISAPQTYQLIPLSAKSISLDSPFKVENKKCAFTDYDLLHRVPICTLYQGDILRNFWFPAVIWSLGCQIKHSRY
jgi:hypothetical protein